MPGLSLITAFGLLGILLGFFHPGFIIQKRVRFFRLGFGTISTEEQLSVAFYFGGLRAFLLSRFRNFLFLWVIGGDRGGFFFRNLVLAFFFLVVRLVGIEILMVVVLAGKRIQKEQNLSLQKAQDPWPRKTESAHSAFCSTGN